MLRAAGRVVVVADSSKFGQKSLTLVSPLDAIDLVVSDNGLPDDWRQKIAAAGSQLIVAQVPDIERESSAASSQRHPA